MIRGGHGFRDRVGDLRGDRGPPDPIGPAQAGLAEAVAGCRTSAPGAGAGAAGRAVRTPLAAPVLRQSGSTVQATVRPLLRRSFPPGPRRTRLSPGRGPRRNAAHRRRSASATWRFYWLLHMRHALRIMAWPVPGEQGKHPGVTRPHDDKAPLIQHRNLGELQALRDGAHHGVDDAQGWPRRSPSVTSKTTK